MGRKHGSKKPVETSVIGGADGPTSVFVLKNDRSAKAALKQKMYKIGYHIRRKIAERSVRASAHSMEEVGGYICDVLGFSEVSQETEQYRTEYEDMRASFMIMYAPELLGDLAQPPEFDQLPGSETEKLREFMRQTDLRREAAKGVPKEKFDIAFHKYEKAEGGLQMHISTEGRYGYIGGGAAWDTKKEWQGRRYGRLYRKVYRYYGVTQEDIDCKTKRYEDLIRTLAVR